MKPRIIAIFFLFLQIVVFPRHYKHGNSYIHLINGNIYYGKIIEKVEFEHIIVKTLSENMIFIKWDDIKFINFKKPLDLDTLEREKQNFLKTKLIFSTNFFFNRHMCIYLGGELPLKFSLKKNIFIKTDLLYDPKYCTNIDLLFGYRFQDIKTMDNFFISFALGLYYSLQTKYDKRYGTTAEIMLGITSLTNDLKGLNISIGLKFLSIVLTEIFPDGYSFEEGTDAYLTISIGINL